MKLKLILFLLAPMLFGSPIDHISPPPEYADLIYAACYNTGVPVNIACGIIAEESDWDTTAIGWINGKAYAGGLMQLAFKYHDDYRYRYNDGLDFDEFNAGDSIRIGLRYFASLHRWLGTYRRACYFYATGYCTDIKRWVRRLVDRELGE